jgi:CBS-domain-containing membrane protein
MKAADVMVRRVITVGPDASVQHVASVLLKNRISAVPVVGEDGMLLGIVSEGDLMRRPEAGTERRRSWWLDLFTTNETRAAEFAKSHARRASDVMTRSVVTASSDTPLSEIADLLEKNGIKRVPVLKRRKLVGIVSRANLLQALASVRKTTTKKTATDDAAIREKVIANLDAQPWAGSSLINVIVHQGTVELWGMVDSQAAKKGVRVAAEATPGVRAVNNNLMIRPLLAAT